MLEKGSRRENYESSNTSCAITLSIVPKQHEETQDATRPPIINPTLELFGSCVIICWVGRNLAMSSHDSMEQMWERCIMRVQTAESDRLDCRLRSGPCRDCSGENSYVHVGCSHINASARLTWSRGKMTLFCLPRLLGSTGIQITIRVRAFTLYLLSFRRSVVMMNIPQTCWKLEK